VIPTAGTEAGKAGLDAPAGSVAVAAPHPLAVEAAEQAVRDGGNALDAALAAACVLVVAYPHQCSLGGDLTALVRRPDGTVEALLSLGAAPAAVDVDALRALGGTMPGQGPHPVTVPGVVPGWAAIAALGARLGLAAPLERAAALAAGGTPVVAGLVRAIETRRDVVAADPGLRDVLMPGGEALTAGATFAQPALAATLRALAADPTALHRGALAAEFARGLQALGSAITVEDLAAHEVERPVPLSAELDGVRWWAAPPPAQGPVALGLLDPELPGDLLTRARAAHAARARLLGDPRGATIDVDGLLRPAPLTGPSPVVAPATGDTVAVTAVDDDGWSVALIQSVYMTFGAGLLEPGTGIVLHNRGGAFSLEAGHPALIGPGRRPPHTLCPLLGEGPGVRVALGCQGGPAQPLILAQVAGGAADPAADPDAVLGAPRWIVGRRDVGFVGETVLAEQGAVVPPSAAADGLTVAVGERHEDRCGHVQLARAVPGGLQAAADPRADGRSAVVPLVSIPDPRSPS
jgi:gamma-glutamyltranspeptidase